MSFAKSNNEFEEFIKSRQLTVSFFSVKKIADILSITPRYVAQLYTEGRLEGIKVGSHKGVRIFIKSFIRFLWDRFENMEAKYECIEMILKNHNLIKSF